MNKRKITSVAVAFAMAAGTLTGLGAPVNAQGAVRYPYMHEDAEAESGYSKNMLEEYHVYVELSEKRSIPSEDEKLTEEGDADSEGLARFGNLWSLTFSQDRYDAVCPVNENGEFLIVEEDGEVYSDKVFTGEPGAKEADQALFSGKYVVIPASFMLKDAVFTPDPVTGADKDTPGTELVLLERDIIPERTDFPVAAVTKVNLTYVPEVSEEELAGMKMRSNEVETLYEAVSDDENAPAEGYLYQGGDYYRFTEEMRYTEADGWIFENISPEAVVVSCEPILSDMLIFEMQYWNGFYRIRGRVPEENEYSGSGVKREYSILTEEGKEPDKALSDVLTLAVNGGDLTGTKTIADITPDDVIDHVEFKFYDADGEITYDPENCVDVSINHRYFYDVSAALMYYEAGAFSFVTDKDSPRIKLAGREEEDLSWLSLSIKADNCILRWLDEGEDSSITIPSSFVKSSYPTSEKKGSFAGTYEDSVMVTGFESGLYFIDMMPNYYNSVYDRVFVLNLDGGFDSEELKDLGDLDEELTDPEASDAPVINLLFGDRNDYSDEVRTVHYVDDVTCPGDISVIVSSDGIKELPEGTKVGSVTVYDITDENEENWYQVTQSVYSDADNYISGVDDFLSRVGNTAVLQDLPLEKRPKAGKKLRVVMKAEEGYGIATDRINIVKNNKSMSVGENLLVGYVYENDAVKGKPREYSSFIYNAEKQQYELDFVMPDRNVCVDIWYRQVEKVEADVANGSAEFYVRGEKNDTVLSKDIVTVKFAPASEEYVEPEGGLVVSVLDKPKAEGGQPIDKVEVRETTDEAGDKLYAFNMPVAPKAYVNAEYVKKSVDPIPVPVKYTIDYDKSSVGGTVSGNAIEAVEGEKIVLSYQVDYGYSFNGFVVRSGGGNITVQEENGEHSFIMPAGDVIVYGSFTSSSSSDRSSKPSSGGSSSGSSSSSGGSSTSATPAATDTVSVKLGSGTVIGTVKAKNTDGLILASVGSLGSVSDVIVNKNGEPVKNSLAEIGGKAYLTDENGYVLKEGFYRISNDIKGLLSGEGALVVGDMVYVSADGSLEKGGVFRVEGHRYNALASGKIVTNDFWTTDKGNKVYSNDNGRIVTKSIFTAMTDSKKYYAVKSGKIVTNKDVVFEGKKYRLDENGVAAEID